jgi:hypothetical protein
MPTALVARSHGAAAPHSECGSLAARRSLAQQALGQSLSALHARQRQVVRLPTPDAAAASRDASAPIAGKERPQTETPWSVTRADLPAQGTLAVAAYRAAQPSLSLRARRELCVRC